MEPFTTLIVGAIALGAAAGAKPTVEQAVKDAYAGLKQVIIDRYNHHTDLIDAMEFLAKKPQDANRRESFESELKNVEVIDDTVVIDKAKSVHAAVKKFAPEILAAIGMDIEELNAAILEVENVRAGTSGIGVRIGKAQIEGTASFKNIGGEDSIPNT